MCYTNYAKQFNNTSKGIFSFAGIFLLFCTHFNFKNLAKAQVPKVRVVKKNYSF